MRIVQQRESAPDDGVADLADRHGARHRARPAQPQQLVGVGEVVDRGGAVDPVDAVPQALSRAGLTLDDMDLIESNEAFAAQACAVSRLLDFDPEKVNPNGSGISLGHPVGATGAIIATKAIHELHRTGGRYALTTMCIGGGQGIAAIFERA